MTRILVTGVAGFIGFHLVRQMLSQGYEVVGVDNLNDYYSVQLKEDRLAQLEGHDHFSFERMDLACRDSVERIFAESSFSQVIHLAAQAGVRYSLTNPHAYVDSNLIGFVNLLEGCRHAGVSHLIYASSSSVYGSNRKTPFSVRDRVDHPISLYAATKKANELMAHTYSHLYGLATTGLRFFTVYGPWGRPDMALYRFTDAIVAGRPIDLYNHGKMRRDFTYVDDIVRGICRLLERDIQQPSLPSKISDPSSDPSSEPASALYKIYNIGNNQPVELEYFVDVLETCLGRKAKRNLLPMQPGDVRETYADIDDLMRDTGFRPSTQIEDGIQSFVDWYLDYYEIAPA